MTIVDAAHYARGRRLELGADWSPPVEEGFSWIGLFEPDPEEFDGIRQALGLHELAVEDATDANQRPKLEVYGDSLFVAVRTAAMRPNTDELVFGELQLFVAARSVVVVRHGDVSELTAVRARLESDPEALAGGPMAVLHAILDRVVDCYEPVVESLGDAVEAVEEAVFSDDGIDSIEQVYELKRQVLHLLGATRPLMGPLESIIAGKTPLEGRAAYFRDVQDNLARVVERVETYRELLTTVFQANLTQVSVRLAEVGVRQNEDMRRISAWVAIAASPTVIAGIYGMNFRHMPELDWRLGYPLSLGAMVLSCVVLFVVFRRAKWL
jgi:magnesium transporter